MQRIGNYWHMLPEYAQARKAIWDAVNPHTGLRRIDEAFPKEVRKATNGQEMRIEFVNGSTWQVVGSDSYNRLVGSSPIGVVFSEWALANSQARGFLRPMLLENGGWQLYITTPRGRNHAQKTLRNAERDPAAFAQVLTVDHTGVFTAEQLEGERKALAADYGEDAGQSLFEQEYYCSFDAAILGAYYGRETARVDKEGRFTVVPYDDAVPVHTAWDIGYRDDTAIWWFQVVGNEIHVIDYHAASGRTVEDYAAEIKARPYRYGEHWLPHDARAKTLASGGKSVEEMLRDALGMTNVRIVPNLSVQDGIQAARAIFSRCWFDHKTEAGLDALRQYQREWDDDKRAFRERPRHDWTSHPSDAFRMLAVSWKHEIASQPAPVWKPKNVTEMTVEELWSLNNEREYH